MKLPTKSRIEELERVYAEARQSYILNGGWELYRAACQALDELTVAQTWRLIAISCGPTIVLLLIIVIVLVVL